MFKILTFVICFISVSNAQNLLINGSFEEHRGLKDTLLFCNTSVVKNLAAPKNQSFDYYHTSLKRKSIPKNIAGNQSAYEGSAYLGISITGNKKGITKECPFRTYVQLELKEHLEINRIYNFSCVVSLAEWSGFAASNFGVVFTEKSVEDNIMNMQMGFIDIELNNATIIEDTSNWVQLTGKYRARGNEKYMLFGNFAECNLSSRKVWNESASKDALQSMKNNYMSKLHTNPFLQAHNELSSFAYYFVDDFSLTRTDSILKLQYLKELQVQDSIGVYINNNLVADGSFNQNFDSQNPQWINPNLGTPDFKPNKTAGLYVFSKANRNDREYIACKLKKPLEPCKEYILKLSIKNSLECKFMADKFQVALSSERPIGKGRSRLLLNPFFSTPTNFLIGQDNIHIIKKFKPDSCENYLVLGNFDSDINTFVYPFLNIPSYAYYIIDDISVFETDSSSDCQACVSEEIALKHNNVNKSAVIYLFFEIGKTVPIDKEWNRLNDFLKIYSEKKIIRISVEGHADNTGIQDINIKLSRDRANEVGNYLDNKLNNEIPIQIDSYSNTLNLTKDELNEVGIENNRRVRVIINYYSD